MGGRESRGNDDGLTMTDADFRSPRCARLKRERENTKGYICIYGERDRERDTSPRYGKQSN